MSPTANAAQKLQVSLRRVVHPFIDSFLPVTYTAHEVLSEKLRLDPNRARSRRLIDPESTTRILRFAEVLRCDSARIVSLLEEATRVDYAPIPRDDQPDLASPMCWEDRYTLYVVTRATAPTKAVETGVAHGISSTFILAAMGRADKGTLTSIEIIDDDPRIGQAVPPHWRSRWQLRFGDSRTVLPAVLGECGGIDMFVHDSRHDYSNVWWEFEMAWPHLGAGGVLCAHDILENNAFPRFVKKHECEIAAWARGINFGLIRKHGCAAGSQSTCSVPARRMPH